MTKNDLDAFWKADEEAHKENCFNPEAAQVALGLRMSEECVYAELGEEGDPWNIEALDPARRAELNKRYNGKAVDIVGIPLLPEDFDPPGSVFPYVKRIGEVFEGEYTMGDRTGEWLHNDSMNTNEELETLLDRVDALLDDGAAGLKEFMYPTVWEEEKTRIYELYGKRPPLLRHIRGPVTLASSLFGVENLTYLSMDAPELFVRFGDTIRRVVLAMARLSDMEAGYSEAEAPRGFSFADDDCQLFNPEMYEQFGYPVLKSVFETYSPDPEDKRYQHSDSAMAHHIPMLATLNLTGCNFGPTVLVEEIRTHMPKTRIDGCLAPFTFMNNDKDKIRGEIKRDCEALKRTGTRGLNLFTAGSINNGSSLESMRTAMESILEFGQF